jgi:transposase InsO family protein
MENSPERRDSDNADATSAADVATDTRTSAPAPLSDPVQQTPVNTRLSACCEAHSKQSSLGTHDPSLCGGLAERRSSRRPINTPHPYFQEERRTVYDIFRNPAMDSLMPVRRGQEQLSPSASQALGIAQPQEDMFQFPSPGVYSPSRPPQFADHPYCPSSGKRNPINLRPVLNPFPPDDYPDGDDDSSDDEGRGPRNNMPFRAAPPNQPGDANYPMMGRKGRQLTVADLKKVVPQFSGKPEDWPLWSARLKTALDPYGLRDHLEQVDRSQDVRTWSPRLTQAVAINKFLYNLLLGLLDEHSEIIARAEGHEHGMLTYKLTADRILGAGAIRHRVLLNTMQSLKWDPRKQPIERFLADLKLIVHQLWSCGFPVTETQHLTAIYRGLPPHIALDVFVANKEIDPYASLSKVSEELRSLVNSLQRQGRLRDRDTPPADPTPARDTSRRFGAGKRTVGNLARRNTARVAVTAEQANDLGLTDDFVAALAECSMEDRLEFIAMIDKRKCYICGKEGHLARVCPSRQVAPVAAATTVDAASESPASEDYVSDEEVLELVTYLADDANAEEDIVAACAPASPTSINFLVDSGGTVHLCKHKSMFTKYTPRISQVRTVNDSDQTLQADGVGTVRLNLKDSKGRVRKVDLKNVLHCPGAAFNILSVHALKLRSVKVDFTSDLVTVSQGHSFPIHWSRKLPYLLALQSGNVVASTAVPGANDAIDPVVNLVLTSPSSEVNSVPIFAAISLPQAEPDDWQLARPIFNMLDKLWGPHDLDVFASEASHQVAKYFNRHQDAFKQEWKGSRLWINPPWVLIPQVLEYVEKHVVDPFTLIAPLWDITYTSRLSQLALSTPVVLPHDENTFVRLSTSSVVRARPPWTHTLAWNCRVGASPDNALLASISAMIGDLMCDPSDPSSIPIVATFDATQSRPKLEGNLAFPNQVVEASKDNLRLHIPAELLPSGRKLTPFECAVWHLKLGHPGQRRMQYLLRDSWPPDLQLPPCDACALGKAKLHAFPREASERSFVPGYRVHVDRWISPSEGINGVKVELGFTDDASRYRAIYHRPDKTGSLKSIQKYIQYYGKPKAIRADGEFWTNEVTTWCRENSIITEKTAPYHHQQNGVSERTFGVLHDIGRSNLIWSELPKEWWPYAHKYACFATNLLPCSANAKSGSPHQVRFGTLGPYKLLGPWGCKSYVTIPPEKQVDKLSPRAHTAIMLGPSRTYRAVKFFVPLTGTIVKSVHFKLTSVPGGRLLKEVVPMIDRAIAQIEPPPKPTRSFEASKPDACAKEHDLSHPSLDNTSPAGIRRSTRLRGKRVDYTEPDTQDIDNYIQAYQTGELDPNDFSHLYEEVDEKTLTPKSIQHLADYELWKQSQCRELKELEGLKVWRLTSLPSGRRTIKHKWVFRRKLTSTGTVERYKARLVAKGFTQIAGLDFHETFSPVVRHETVRLFLATCASQGRTVYQADIGNAYLNAPLAEEVYIDIPDGYGDYLRRKPPDQLAPDEVHYLNTQHRPGHVMLLLKGLPGLRQVGRNWHEMFTQWLQRNGFTQCPVDPCLFYTASRDMFVSTHVDDCLFGPVDEDTYQILLKKLEADFKVTSGLLSWFLGIAITQDGTHIVMSQEQYALRVLKRFSMDDCATVSSPMIISANSVEDNTGAVDLKLYRSAIGSLIHLAKWTRPDLAFAISYCARAMAKPTELYWTYVKRIFRYLRKTASHAIAYKKGVTASLIGYSDSDFANCSTSRKSISGFVFVVDKGPISWKSSKQELVATSTLEAEYIALFSASQEALFLQRLLAYITSTPVVSICIWVDNQGAIAIAKNPEFHKRTKHIGVKYHAIRERFIQNLIEVKYVKTDENLADVFTKPLAPPAFANLEFMYSDLAPTSVASDPLDAREGECQE